MLGSSDAGVLNNSIAKDGVAAGKTFRILEEYRPCPKTFLVTSAFALESNEKSVWGVSYFLEETSCVERPERPPTV